MKDIDMFTILIAARDAAQTIERAIRSCMNETRKILLVDDHCKDDTVERAKQIAGNRLEIVRAPDPGGIPVARQAALEAVQTPFAAWLDADDEWLPGRAERLLKRLAEGSDIVSEKIDLHDGATGKYLRTLEVPAFVRKDRLPVRLFERNYMHGDTQVGFRTEVFREAGGYDPLVFGPESYDLLLRALARGATFSFLDTTGYRMYAYPGSVSRNLPRIRAATRRALAKHSFDDVRQQCLSVGYIPRMADWILVSMAVFREEFGAALEFLDRASPVSADPMEILDTNGSLPYPEGWKRAFFRGGLLMQIGNHDHEAETELLKAEEILPTPEGANNLGVAAARLGRKRQALELFALASERFPGYLDAKLNLNADVPVHITTHPIRRQASRFEY